MTCAPCVLNLALLTPACPTCPSRLSRLIQWSLHSARHQRAIHDVGAILAMLGALDIHEEQLLFIGPWLGKVTRSRAGYVAGNRSDGWIFGAVPADLLANLLRSR